PPRRRGQVEPRAGPAAVDRRIHVRPVQLTAPAATAAARAAPPLTHQRPRQQRIKPSQRRRQSPPARAELTDAQSLQIRVGHEPVWVSCTGPPILQATAPSIAATTSTRPASTSPVNGQTDAAGARSVASSG